MGKRNTAKTGDKALYNSRDQQSSTSDKFVDDDDMYNEVDRYNNAHDELQDDMIKFGEKDESEEEGMQNDVEGVFDLGLDRSEDESSSDNDSSEDDERSTPRLPLQGRDREDSDSDDDSSMDGLDDVAETNILDWGKRKKDYYHGDTADLEIGQEVEDAELEEKGAQEILKARMENMTEDDFMLENDDDSEVEDADDDIKGSGDVEMISSRMHSAKRRKLSKLSKKEKVKLMTKTHPELIPLVCHFRDKIIRPCAEETSVVVKALLQNDQNAEDVGATSAGLQYLLTKAMVESATALNVCQYLLIKRDQAESSNDADNIITQDEGNIKNHPVISRLDQLNLISDKLGSKIESKVGGLTDQLHNLVKASALMSDTAEGEDALDDDSQTDVENARTKAEELIHSESEVDTKSDDTSTASSESDDEDGQILRQKALMNEARFALRKQDDDEVTTSSLKRRRRRALPAFSDFGDDDENVNENDVAAAGKSLATTINRISQRSKSSNKPSLAPEANDEDDADRFKQGLEMMKADLGDDYKDSDGDLISDDDIDEDEDDDFYAQIKKKSEAKKEYKKNLYAVAPKYPGMDDEIVGERALGQRIMKNRGLVAHKNKLSRNPRVKKREQYRKALIKRKGAIREVRTEEAHKYGGEETGIKSGISRSRKLGVK